MNNRREDSDMKTNYRGLFDNTKVSNGLIPLFEVIMNSIHAIEDAKKSDGKITIEVLRDAVLPECGDGDICGFRVTDNGVGFNGKNFEAFDTVFTENKIKRGGKGFGRISWLCVFVSAEVESVFIQDEDGRFLKRHFTFLYKDEPIEKQEDDNQVSEKLETGTVVTLKTFRSAGKNDKYVFLKRNKAETIAKEIIVHFFRQFNNRDFPQVMLEDGEFSINLNQLLEQNTDSAPARSYIVGDKVFQIEHVKIRKNFLDLQKLYFCAHGRVVKVENVDKVIPHIPKKFKDEKGDFIYIAFIRSDFLDENVNTERTEFTIPETLEEGGILEGEISWKTILESTGKDCQNFLSEYLQPLQQEREKRIREFLARKKEYSGIYSYAGSKLEELPYDCSEKDIKKVLDTASITLDEDTPGWDDFSRQNLEKWGLEEFSEKFDEQIKKIDTLKGFNLSKYVLQRKFILDALERF